MALDWSREISFSGLKRSKARSKAAYPVKTRMNLLSGEQQDGGFRRTAPAAIAVVLVAALFIKFGVFDFYARVADKQVELSKQTQALAVMASAAADYDDVLAEYEGYESTGKVDSGLSVDALEAMSLVDKCVAPYARVASLTMEGDEMSLKLADSSLDQLGKLVGALERQDVVASVNLSTAGTQGSKSGEVSATVTVSLQSPAENDGKEG